MLSWGNFLFSQDNFLYDDYFNNIIALDFDEAENIVDLETDSITKWKLNTLILIIKNRGRNKTKDSLSINSKIFKHNNSKSALDYLLEGYYRTYNTKKNYDALQSFSKAYNLGRNTSNKILLKLSLIAILELYTIQIRHTTLEHEDYLNKFKLLIENQVDEAIYYFYLNGFHARSIHSPPEFYISSKELLRVTSKTNLSPALRGRIQDNFTVYYRVIKKEDSAIYFNKEILKLPNNNYNKVTKLNALKELALIAAKNNESVKAKNYLKKAKRLVNLSDTVYFNYTFDRFKSIYVNAPLKEFDSAFYLLRNAMRYEANQNFKENKEKISNLKVRLETAEKEKQILSLKNENLEKEKLQKNTEIRRKQNQSIALALAGTLTLGSIIAFLLFKNTKRKQKLAEQEKQLESQKLATVLKEQELVTIDAMIEGQEKERQRIANDLHDDLGGLMATVKLHFNALQDNASPDLFNKTNTLIEEAYQKVRLVAHAKNSGVIAKQGLLKAVQQMADKVSASNKIHIEVLDHGLDNRLENSLELTLFRIMQELITNIVKHAKATTAEVHLTNHEDSINIMVEDNGKGFNPSQVTKTNKGMGISSIDKRVAHLDGVMTIESEPNKGTTIIIDIPLTPNT